MDLLFPGIQDDRAKLCVVGVGGAGGNAVNTMISQGLEGVEVIAVNTDRQALDSSLAAMKVVIGTSTTRGLGAGANPERGRAAAIENEDALASLLQDKDLVFVAAGMGGGTGTGAAPVVAQVARRCGALTVGVVTRPFDFEGRQRGRNADAGLRELAAHVDSLIVVPNQRLLSVLPENTGLVDAFKAADQVLFNAVAGMSLLIRDPGLINVDFADVRTILSLRGVALMGTGVGRGPRRAFEAVQQAISSPLLDNVKIEGARGVLLHFKGSSSMGLNEVSKAAEIVRQEAHGDLNLIFGTTIDESMGDEIRVTVVATGFDTVAPQYAAIQEASQRAHHDTAPNVAVERADVAHEVALRTESSAASQPSVGTLPPARPLPPSVALPSAPMFAAGPTPTPASPAALGPLTTGMGSPARRSRLVERATSMPVPGAQPVFGGPRPSMAPPALAPVRTPTRVVTVARDPAELAVPPAQRAGRQTGEAPQGADFWSEGSDEPDPTTPRFPRGPRRD